jgi:transposase
MRTALPPIPEHTRDVRCVWLPPHAPELSPLERVWRDGKEDLAWLRCPDVDTHQHEVGDLYCADEVGALQSLTAYAAVVDAMHARCL